MSKRYTYTSAQLTQFFTHISLPKSHHRTSISGLSPKETLTFLALLQKFQLVAVPFDNFALHYSPHHDVIIDPEFVFQKVVCSEGKRGGYCMENNQLFYTVLLSLGFDVYTAAARVSAGQGHGAYGHQISIVTIDGQKYHVDVGFGSNAALQPIPIIKDPEDGAFSEVPNIASGVNRIIWQHIEEFTNPDQRVWELQYRRAPDAPWFDCYAFTENEFLPADFATFNYSISQSSRSMFTQKLLGVKYTMDENEEITGAIILNGDRIKYEVNYEKVMIIDGFASEEERARAVEKWFGIKISDLEIRSIKGLPSALNSAPRASAADMSDVGAS